MNILDLEKQLKEQRLNSLYLFYGKEKYLLETNLRKIKKIFGDLFFGLNYIKIDSSSISTLISEMQTPAFGYDKKLIIIKDSEILTKQGKKQSVQVKEIADEIAEYIQNNFDEICEQNVVIFIEDEIEKNKLYKLINEKGVVCEFKSEQIQDISKRIKFICNSYKVNIDTYTLNYFIESCGTDLQILINEIRKLIEYVQENGTITKDDIDVLATKQFESIIFDLTDSLGQRNIKRALEVFNNLIYAKEPIQKILITLYNHFKKLYIVQLCLKYNEDVIMHLNLKPNQTFLVNKYKKQAGYFKNNELKNILYEFINLDEGYKKGIIDLNIGLESLICCNCSK